MDRKIYKYLLAVFAIGWFHGYALAVQENEAAGAPNAPAPQLLNKKDDGFRGIWYSVGKTNSIYKVKYGGGLGTYPANHYPFSVYVPKVNKTFFCYGGTDKTGKTLYHEVSYFDHKTGLVARPTILLDKGTNDAHDNPVIQVDKQGYVWIFSTSHGTQRPSCISRSLRPYDIDSFKIVPATKLEGGKRVPLDNFSYLQIHYNKQTGFIGLFTHYEMRDLKFGKKNCRITAWMTSRDGVNWSAWNDLAKIEEGHYQSSAQWKNRIGTAFNYHPNVKTGAGLDYRTNLYYLYTDDNGKTWRNAGGQVQQLPLTNIANNTMVRNYAALDSTVYINDVNFDASGNPVIMYLTSTGPEPGPQSGTKKWFIARWTGSKWVILPITVSDNNYDMGSLYIEADGTWRIIAPTTTGPQAYNTGGEMVAWISSDKGAHWHQDKQLTVNSTNNHFYPRRPVNAHPDFYAFWADGNGREFSASQFYFADKQGNVYKLPQQMAGEMAKPELVK